MTDEEKMKDRIRKYQEVCVRLIESLRKDAECFGHVVAQEWVRGFRTAAAEMTPGDPASLPPMDEETQYHLGHGIMHLLVYVHDTLDPPQRGVFARMLQEVLLGLATQTPGSVIGSVLVASFGQGDSTAAPATTTAAPPPAGCTKH